MIRNKNIYIAHNWSDASLCLQSKALALALSKHNKVFFLNAKKNGFDNVWINENLLILEWPGKRPTGWKDLLFAIKVMRKNRPDIVVSNFAANDILLFTSWLFRAKKRVCYFHTMVEQYIADYGNLPLNQRVNIFRKSLVFKLATQVLPSSVAAKKDLIHYYHVKDANAIIFPNALPDTPVRNKRNNNKTIGFLGRLDHSKGVDILIDAFIKVSIKIPGATLEIVGKGSRETELKKKIERSGNNSNIIFKGLIAYAEVLHFLSSVDIVVVPSRTDNLPTVVLESLSAGSPVIGSNSGGIPDIISDGWNGLLFERENADELSEKIIMLLNDEQKRDEIGRNARKSFEKRYCIDQHCSRFEQMLQV